MSLSVYEYEEYHTILEILMMMSDEKTTRTQYPGFPVPSYIINYSSR